jgi:predicted anti-sigma-YlaC factor YlaD
MTQTSCPSCRLRFTRGSAAHLDACPECTQPLDRTASASDTLGYRLFDIADPRPALPAAIAMALPAPPPARERP